MPRGNAKLRISIGVTSFNEEQNIERLIHSLLFQKLKSSSISEILVVSSGSTDQTNSIIKKIHKKNPKVKLITQKKRLGKASAVNLFLTSAKEDVVILSSADLLIPSDTIEKMIKPFKSKDIGIVGSRPIPVNDPKTFFGFASHLIWDLHHHISLNSSKMGEFIAFRKIFKRIPVTSAVDEASIEALIRGQGYKAYYVSNARVYNKGAENLREFIARRRRIYAGHLETKNKYSYKVSTISNSKILLALLKNFKFTRRFIIWTPLVIALEILSRFLGLIDYKFYPKKHTVWKITPSTKTLINRQTLERKRYT
ncbi:MAG: glycosyltransferase [Candidatus Levybacteria bacterium]|nr:glycosyltransferase [Candidatus Levybacteria bacterium]